jgi:hypothetical protein
VRQNNSIQTFKLHLFLNSSIQACGFLWLNGRIMVTSHGKGLPLSEVLEIAAQDVYGSSAFVKTAAALGVRSLDEVVLLNRLAARIERLGNSLERLAVDRERS